MFFIFLFCPSFTKAEWFFLQEQGKWRASVLTDGGIDLSATAGGTLALIRHFPRSLILKKNHVAGRTK